MWVAVSARSFAQCNVTLLDGLLVAGRGDGKPTLERRDVFSLTLLAMTTSIAWLAWWRSPHAMGLLPYLSGWTLMMVAMMLPSIAPLVLLVRGNRSTLAAGYLTAWAASGLIPWLAMKWSFQPMPWIVLGVAGVYELTPLKDACLRHCHNAATFLMEHYRSGPFKLGMEHGLWCIGCCVGLMAVLVLAGSMRLTFAAGLAVVVFIQKVFPWPVASARVTGVALIVSALALALR